ncbi:MAG: hypothetical protein R2848_08070 [Thermomicrobiales bacterium]
MLVQFLTQDDLAGILRRTTSSLDLSVEPTATGETILEMGRLAREVPIASGVSEYVVRLVMASHPENPRAT